eukprot:gene24251-27433_t
MISYYDLGPDKKLNEVVMAGSHDAAVTMGDANTQTQDLDIFDQAVAGARLFDIRITGAVVKKGGADKVVALKAYHGKGPESKTTGDGAVEQALGQRTGQHGVGIQAAGRFAEHGDVLRVAAEGCDIAAHPLQRGDQVQRAEVAGAVGLLVVILAGLLVVVLRQFPQAEPAEDAYGIKRGDGYTAIYSGRGDMKELGRLEGTVKGDFIWYRDGNQAWLIKDPALLAKATAAWAPADALNLKMKEHNKAMEQHSKAMEVLGEKMRAISEQAERQERRVDHSRIDQVAREQEAVARRMEAVGRRMERSRETGADREALQREMEALKTQMEPFKQQMRELTAEFAKTHADMAARKAPMQALSAEMREASKPMKELGEKMGELGREQGRLSREADRTVRELIQEAVRNGQAETIPAPKG